MTGVVGALVALGVVAALVLVLAVRPHVRRLQATLAALQADTTAGLAQLRAIRADRPNRPGPNAPEVRDRGTRHVWFRLGSGPRSQTPVPPAAAAGTSPIGGPGRHRRAEPAP